MTTTTPKQQLLPHPRTSLWFALAAFYGMAMGGYSPGSIAEIPGTGYQIDAGLIALILSIVTTLLPKLIELFAPALLPVVQPIIDFLRALFDWLTPEDRKAAVESQQKMLSELTQKLVELQVQLKTLEPTLKEQTP